MRILIPLVAIIILILALFLPCCHAQTNPSPDVNEQISNLTAQVAALQKQSAPTNPVLQSVTYSNGIAVSTNSVAPTAGAVVSTELQPLFNLLGGKTQSMLATVMAWFLAISTLVAPWRTKIKHLISDKFNEVAAESSPDQDTYLRTLFGKGWYKLSTLLLAFAGITLPNTSDLDRVIAAQNEASANTAQAISNQVPVSAP